jgi:hypothetical protein
VVRAWPHDGIHPLEIWDVEVGDATLFSLRDEPSFYTSLASAVLALRAGRAVREDGTRLPACPWDAVALVGGALDEAAARDAFDAARVPLDVVAADPFFASSHAREVLAELGPAYDGAVVIDVGQTSVKGVGPTTRIHRPRVAGAVVLDARAELVTLASSALTEACAGVPPAFVLLALPCEVETRDGALVLGASTYPTAGEGAALVREVLVRAGCEAAASAVVNDAVLAAWALAQRVPSQTQSRLVLTLGLGVGAALVDRAPAA